jgi:hypothetical protein
MILFGWLRLAQVCASWIQSLNFENKKLLHMDNHFFNHYQVAWVLDLLNRWLGDQFEWKEFG